MSSAAKRGCRSHVILTRIGPKAASAAAGRSWSAVLVQENR
jgi:hypothetical protein